jgi:hypothetical protein
VRRRTFISLLGGAAVGWPLSVGAQQGERMRRVGVIIVNAENDPEGQARIAAFRRGLQELRWTDGSNLIDYRWGVSEPVRARALVGELVSFTPDVVVVNGTPGLAALQDTTRTIPVVFVMVRARGRGSGPVRGPRATCRDYLHAPRRWSHRLSALLTDTLRLVRSGRSADWLKSKNPACEAVRREAEEDWGR